MPQTVDMNVQYVDPMSIKPNPDNPRIHPESEIKKLVNSMRAFGFANPILVDKEMVVISGHARLKAAKNIELEKVPIIVLDLDHDEAMAYMVADNRIANESQWDNVKLEGLIQEIYDSDIGLDLTGFNAVEYEKMLGEVADAMDEVVPPESDDEIPMVGMRIPAGDLEEESAPKPAPGSRIPSGDNPEDDPEPTYVIMITFNDEGKANEFLHQIGIEEDIEGYTKQIDGNELSS